jgi:PhnB protein
MAAQPVPEGYPTLTPYLALDDAAGAIEFYKRAFGAVENSRMEGPDGKIGHAELKIGDSLLMLADAWPQSSTRPPKEVGTATGGVFVYIEDIDALFKQAIDAGATSVMDPENMFWGDRFGTLTDPYGHVWHLATHVEDVSPEDMQKRAAEWQAQMAEMAGAAQQ